MNKIIGVDIDAVLTDEGTGTDNIWHQKICNYFNLEERKEQVYDFRDAYGLTLEEIEEFMATEGRKIFANVSPLTEAKEVLADLQQQGCTIILVTARAKEHNQVTLDWLDEHQIPFDKLIHSEEKANICQAEGIELFIDDRVSNLLPIKELGIPVLLMDMDHNQSFKGPIPRVHNWQEIKEQLEQILKGA
ncbi:hypothetical protein Halha_1368 [Halobacteroides halobius DSM 5150]|uniref:Nucleotidase n=1 Tax=Halobacteroides halobius (strain ATCC 35273 / DSM 5150 / MD-1) TaxID=748449 RepID=L0KB74_HALHC|nr:hypothetical protein [Halobacteroides halobius]AGB41313.1 hypothetical protein Halha_1368 [Halobacteroides halobius DSM 5150]